jgi:hypothetical protein
MTADLHNLIEALRNELQQYGEMLALFDHPQQGWAAQRDSEDHCPSVAAIQAQSQTIHAAQLHRRSVQQHLARSVGQADDVSLTILIPLVPEPYRPLISALVQENHELLQRIQQRASQNHGLLQPSAELMRNFIAGLSSPDPAGPAGDPAASPRSEILTPVIGEPLAAPALTSC